MALIMAETTKALTCDHTHVMLFPFDHIYQCKNYIIEMMLDSGVLVNSIEHNKLTMLLAQDLLMAKRSGPIGRRVTNL